MFVVVEGRNHWGAEEAFVEEFKKEAGLGVVEVLEGSQVFLAYIQANPAEVDFLFMSSVLSLMDSRSSMSNRVACYWFAEHRKVEKESIVLSDVFDIHTIDARIRKLVTHRILVTGDKDDVRYRVVNLNVGRAERGKLGERSILEAIKKSDEPPTPEEIEQQEKEFEQALGELSK